MLKGHQQEPKVIKGHKDQREPKELKGHQQEPKELKER